MAEKFPVGRLTGVPSAANWENSPSFDLSKKELFDAGDGGNMKTGNWGIVIGFFLFGIGLGFLFTPYLGFLYGMPAGIFIGIGIGVVVQQFAMGIRGSEGNSANPSDRKKRRNG